MSEFDCPSAIAESRLFARVARFIVRRSPHVAYREAASDRAWRATLWSPHWPALRDATEQEAALLLCFLLACATLRVDVVRALAAVRQSTRPELSMRLFLSERGLMLVSAFDPVAAADGEPFGCEPVDRARVVEAGRAGRKGATSAQDDVAVAR